MFTITEERPSVVSNQQPSSATKLHVVLVEDNPFDIELVERELHKAGFEFTAAAVQRPEDFLQELRAQRPQIVLADYNLPQWRGMDALELLRREQIEVPFILVSGALGDVTAVECIKNGATDYVLKGNLARLGIAIRRALQEQQLRDRRRQAQEELAVKAEELARSNRDLEQFAYVASHDLQEPLRMVAAYTQLLAERYRGKLDETADKYIAYASEGALRMQALIQDLLAFSRVGRNGGGTSVDCNVALKEALKNLNPAIQESGAEIRCENLPVVWAAAAPVAQVFQNLVGNAIKFRVAGKIPRIVIEAEQTGPLWLFTVTDNGIGIAPEHAEAIFTIFQRLHTRAEYPGNGIGLAICRKIVERYGGKIWVESQPSQGSTFKFTLRAHASQEEEPQP
jgi:signal transduction histidine kinase